MCVCPVPRLLLLLLRSLLVCPPRAVSGGIGGRDWLLDPELGLLRLSHCRRECCQNESSLEIRPKGSGDRAQGNKGSPYRGQSRKGWMEHTTTYTPLIHTLSRRSFRAGAGVPDQRAVFILRVQQDRGMETYLNVHQPRGGQARASLKETRMKSGDHSI